MACARAVINTALYLLMASPFSPGIAWGGQRDAAMTAPLPVHNLYPPMLRFFDPVPVSAFTPYGRKPRYSLLQHYTSVFQFDALPDGRLLTDMEIYTLELSVDKAVSQDTEVGVMLPLHYAWDGFMDGFLRNYHDTLGLPNGGRGLRPDNEYAWRYRDGAGSLAWDDGPGWETGNMTLRLRHRLTARGDHRLAALAAIQLPTGSSSRGWSTGSAVVAAGMVYSRRHAAWFGHLQGWGIYPFADDSGDDGFRPYARGSATLGWQWKTRWSLLAQVQGGTSPYRAGIRELDQDPWQVSFGFHHALGRKANLTIAFVENISQQTAPDFGVSLGLSLLRP